MTKTQVVIAMANNIVLEMFRAGAHLWLQHNSCAIADIVDGHYFSPHELRLKEFVLHYVGFLQMKK